MNVYGQEQMESFYVVVCAYACFQIGEVVGLSGIIVCLFGGIIMGVYQSPNLKDAETVDTVLDTCARMADLVTFIICGFGVFRMEDGWMNPGIVLGLLTIVFCF